MDQRTLSPPARKQLDEHETRKYIRQIVSAVDHMHKAQVIHRDIKLQNFMLDQNNDIIIIGNVVFDLASRKINDAFDRFWSEQLSG